MTRIAVALLLLLPLAAPNTFAGDNNPPAPPQTQATPETKPQPPQDPGTRKLSRRERKERIAKLPERYQQFLIDVEPIMQQAELDTFLILESDAQRELYIDDFWHRRDIAQGTSHHAYKDQYYDRLEGAKEKFRNVSSDRSRIYLIHGEPDEILTSDCRLLQPLQIWKFIYIPGLGHDVRFIFYQPRSGIDFRLYTPMASQDVAELISQESASAVGPVTQAISSVFAQVAPGMSRIELECKNGDEIMKALAYSEINKIEIATKVFNPPEINPEDVHKILRSVVLAPPNATKLPAQFSIAYPAKQGTRTAAEMTVLVPRAQVVLKE